MAYGTKGHPFPNYFTVVIGHVLLSLVFKFSCYTLAVFLALNKIVIG